MTAEIGILNKTGVALAADSAVTVGNTKVFNSADKLFSLSKKHPVGIMIYGNANFMGTPWETIIKMYRKKLGDTHFDELGKYCENFFEFLLSDKRFYRVSSENDTIATIFRDFFLNLLQTINNLLVKENFTITPGENEVRNLLYAEADYYQRMLSRVPYINDFNDTYLLWFATNKAQIIDKLIQENVNIDIDQQTKELLYNIAAFLTSKDLFTSIESGIVISGFGEEDIFPSLYSFSVEGIYNNTLKYKLKDKVHISDDNNDSNATAAVVPFAQQEMVHSFMTGVDPLINDEIHKVIKTVVNYYQKVVEDSLGIVMTDDQKNELTEKGSELYDVFKEDFNQLKIEKFLNPITETVAAFPKEELAAMAEALINLTSIKRKMTIQTETVGGPIDVAVISKGDGFIWIKRKHYFKSELNNQYFKNYNER